MAETIDYENFIPNMRAEMAAAKEESSAAEYGKAIEGIDIGRSFGEVVSDVAGFGKRLPRNVGIGVARGALSTIEFADDFFKETAEFIVDPPGRQGEGESKPEPFADVEPAPPLRTLFPGFFEAAHTFLDEVEVDNTLSDDLVQGMTQFIIPFTGYLKAIGGLKNLSFFARAGRLGLAEGLTLGTAFDAQDGRFAELFEMGRQMENDFGRLLSKVSSEDSLVNSYIEMMTADRENESAMTARFKNAVDGVVSTALFAPAFIVTGTTLRRAANLRLRTPEKLQIPENARFLKEGEAEGLNIEPVKLQPEVKTSKLEKGDLRGVAALATAATIIAAEEIFTDDEIAAKAVAEKAAEDK